MLTPELRKDMEEFAHRVLCESGRKAEEINILPSILYLLDKQQTDTTIPENKEIKTFPMRT